MQDDEEKQKIIQKIKALEQAYGELLQELEMQIAKEPATTDQSKTQDS